MYISFPQVQIAPAPSLPFMSGVLTAWLSQVSKGSILPCWLLPTALREALHFILIKSFHQRVHLSSDFSLTNTKKKKKISYRGGIPASGPTVQLINI